MGRGGLRAGPEVRGRPTQRRSSKQIEALIRGGLRRSEKLADEAVGGAVNGELWAVTRRRGRDKLWAPFDPGNRWSCVFLPMTACDEDREYYKDEDRQMRHGFKGAEPVRCSPRLDRRCAAAEFGTPPDYVCFCDFALDDDGATVARHASRVDPKWLLAAGESYYHLRK